VHILVNVPLFTSTALCSVLCIKWFPKNEMVYSTHNLHTCIQQLMNQWWAQGTFAQQNHYSCLPATSDTQN